MKISVKSVALEKEPTEVLVISLFEEKKIIPSELNTLNKALGGTISNLLESKDFTGKLNEIIMIPTNKRIKAKRLMLVGLGKLKELSLERLRQAAGTAARAIQTKKLKNFSILLYGMETKDMSLEDVASSIAEGILLSLYKFTMYKTLKKEEKADIRNITILVQKDDILGKVKPIIKNTQSITDAVGFTRDIVNMAGSDATPSFLANKAKKIARNTGVRCKILSKPDMEKLGMGGILNVSKGSSQPPKFIILEYNTKKKTYDDTLVIIGKGITFDSGGISLKPGKEMNLMKADMAGAAAILGTFMAITHLKPPIHLVGLVPCSENMPGGTALKPGDIIKCLSGKTVEILNTDAEGRLILADAISYAKRYKPDAVIDLATLTGTCAVALGTFASGMFGNNDELKDRVKKAGEKCHERVWELPLWDEYYDLIKSSIADIKNIGGRYGGAITAACFLGEFVKGFPWVHLDIAGTFLVEKDTPYIRKGASGVGVRLLVQLIRDWKKLSNESKKNKK